MQRVIVFVLATVAMANLRAQSFTPENMGTAVNSVYDDIDPVISPDEQTLFFVRVNHPENTYGAHDSEDIWFSEKQYDGTWSEAKRIPSLNIGRYNAVLSISADGKTLLLNGVFNKRGTLWKKRGLSISTKTEDGWSAPQKLKIKRLSELNRGLKSSGTMSADGQFIVLSFSRGYNSKRTNLFVCEKNKNGKWKRPYPIKPLNSTEGSEDTPFLTADNKVLFFSSDYEHNRGQHDIYKVTRMGDDWKSWASPEKVTEVNSEGWDAGYRINAKENWAYFSSEKNAIGGADIYRIKLVEDNPYIIVSGKILHSKTQQPLAGKNFTILVDGTPADSVTVNSDSATYKLVLPRGKSYSLAASTENYRQLPQRLDGSAQADLTDITKDLFAEPLPYVLVKGKLLDKNTGRRIPASAHPKIVINGMPADSASIDSLAGEYYVKVNYGTSYTIQVEADTYESVPGQLDLTDVNEYRVVNLDLKSAQHITPQQPKVIEPVEPVVVASTKVGTATITGAIIDKRTGKALAPSVAAVVKIEGLGNMPVTIDPATRTYEVQLPAGKSYTLSAAAGNYYPVYETINLSPNKGEDVSVKRDLVIVPIEVGQLVRLNNIFFETGRATLKKESFAELDRVAEFLRENPGIKIEIAGHTDNVGSAPFNQALSEARAKSVASYITSRGIKSFRLMSKGYGLSRPVSSNSTAAGRAQNRRVEFAFLDNSSVANR